MNSGFVHIKPTFVDDQSIEKYPELLTCSKPMMLTLGARTGSINISEATILLSRLAYFSNDNNHLVLYGGTFYIHMQGSRVNANIQLALNNDYTLSMEIATDVIQ